jgi:hypothetical protein
MADQRYIKLRIPRPVEFELSDHYQYIPVPEEVVRSGIELLQGFLAQWNNDQGVSRSMRSGTHWPSLPPRCCPLS